MRPTDGPSRLAGRASYVRVRPLGPLQRLQASSATDRAFGIWPASSRPRDRSRSQRPRRRQRSGRAMKTLALVIAPTAVSASRRNIGRGA
jgi:hypothetical protein